MRLTTHTFLIAAAGWCGLTSLSLGHHKWSNTSLPVTLNGRVVKVDWQNPHVQIHLEAQRNNNARPDIWLLEGAAPAQLTREGWTRDTIKPGDLIQASGFQARAGSLWADGVTITLSDKRVLNFRSDIPPPR